MTFVPGDLVTRHINVPGAMCYANIDEWASPSVNSRWMVPLGTTMLVVDVVVYPMKERWTSEWTSVQTLDNLGRLGWIDARYLEKVS